MKRWAPWLVGLACGVVAGVVAWSLAGADVNKLGDWNDGAANFFGVVTVLGAGAGYAVTSLLTRGPAVTRDGFMLTYDRIDPKADGYRDVTRVTLAAVVEALTKVGYAPALRACDDLGDPIGEIDHQVPLAGVNVGIRDPKVRGRIRLQLGPPNPDVHRSMGLIDIWTESGESAEELALFTLRALDGLIANVTAQRQSSALGEDAASLLTAGLGERPRYRR